MSNMKFNYLIAIIVSILLIGCKEVKDPDTVKSEHEVHYELGLLPKIMSMPATPLKVKWQLSGDRNLYALLTYSQEDYKFVIENSTPFEVVSNTKLNDTFYRDWLENKIKLDATYHNGSYEIIGVHDVQANLFVQAEHSPFVNGSVTPLGEGIVLVSLYAM